MEIDITILSSIKIYQPKNGYRFSNEPFVLMKDMDLKDDYIFLDFGSGSGIISILASKINKNAAIYSLENNPDMIDLIKRNAQLNRAGNIKIIEDTESLETNSVDIIVSNPPYFVDGSYRKSKKFYKEKFESINLDKFLKNIRRVIKNKGLLRLSYHPTRFVQIIKKLDNFGFGIKSITPVYGNRKKDAAFIIIESKFDTKSHTIFKEALYLKEFQYF